MKEAFGPDRKVPCGVCIAVPSRSGAFAARAAGPVAAEAAGELTLQHHRHGTSEAGWRVRNADTCSAHRLDLIAGRPLAAGDDGAGMAHPAARGGRDPRYEAYDWFLFSCALEKFC